MRAKLERGRRTRLSVSRLDFASELPIHARADHPLIALPKYLFSGIDVFALMAVPFFILTAELMTGGALSEVLLRFASELPIHARADHPLIDCRPEDIRRAGDTVERQRPG